MKILVIDNYDSFTYNLVQYLQELKAQVTVQRNDALPADEAVDPSLYDGILVSPGPGTPDTAGISIEVWQLAAVRGMPTLGVCLGHQSLVAAFAGKITNAHKIMHGKVSKIRHSNTGVFKDLPDPLTVTRYHSLAADSDNLPNELERTAWTDDDEIMGVRHRRLPLEGVQFHPESIATECGHELLQNWLGSLHA